MNSWINLEALWKILLVGLVTGAGLPALFALGVRALNPPDRRGATSGAAGPTGTTRVTAGGASARPTAGPLGRAVAAVCFAVVLAAIGWGVSVIVTHS